MIFNYEMKKILLLIYQLQFVHDGIIKIFNRRNIERTKETPDNNSIVNKAFAVSIIISNHLF
jgi:hypothetical protein